MAVLLGSIGFLLYFLYDVNSIKWKNSVLHYNFMVGTAMVGGATVYMLVRSVKNAGELTGGTVIVYAVAIVFLLLLIYTLFFALPFDATYVKEENKRLAYTEGVYALCRHPGVLWFIGFYACIGFAVQDKELLIFGAVMSLWNVLYIVFQDIYSFPQTFENYSEYKKDTPFLIPNWKSINRCMLTMRGKRR